MTESSPTGAYVVECFWPGVDAEALRSLDARAVSAGELTRGGTPVSYLGSLLMRDEEVVLCHGLLSRPGSYSATATAAGYAPASVRVTTR